ncbi:MAG: nicotinate phosphoribosyltransferase [Deltaproteobacteria bacterium]|nr:nicotinate phosphoribosyltransferase [Deltaproteobacteria bacterium]
MSQKQSLPIYNRQSLTLYTDLYQLTMGYGYWKLGIADKEACFIMTFRSHPFNGGFSICSGLGPVLEILADFSFEPDDIEYLSSLKGSDLQPLFSKEYLSYLGELKLSVDIDAMEEGSVVFPHEPLFRVKGPILQCQILETLLLNFINFHSLISTKAARVSHAAQGEPVIEFGARRAQGIDGGLSASRACFIGGCSSTSNLLAGKIYGIPVRGTQAHSWIMCFDNELESFEKYLDCMPNNAVLLIDTYDSLNGLKNAIAAAKDLKQKGFNLSGVRLDSGDLAYLSIEARKILDEAGFRDTQIVGSNDLDEFIIKSLKEQGAKVVVWGVGTNLVTASGQSSLGGVYKLCAIKEEDQWIPKIKLSEQTIKINNPGIQQVRRFYSQSGEPVSDAIYDELSMPEDNRWGIIDPLDSLRYKNISKYDHFKDLLVPVLRKGAVVYQSPALTQIRQKCLDDLKAFHDSIKRFVFPHNYPAGLEKNLHQKKSDLIKKLRNNL